MIDMRVMVLQYTVDDAEAIITNLSKGDISRVVQTLAVWDVIGRALRIMFVAKDLLSSLDELLFRELYGYSVVLIIDWCSDALYTHEPEPMDTIGSLGSND